MDHEEIQALATAIGLEVADFVDRYTRRLGTRMSLIEYANGDCVFFNGQSRQCSLYDHRPRQCRTWPFWESNLSTPSDWAETGRACSGVGEGPLATLEAIEAKVRRTQS